jgi:ribosomal protein S18 acetylase RimI-like enzyme
MSHPEYIIEPYSHAHDAALAVMWNESDQQWPGGFTRGVPFTAERIANWMDKQTTLVRLVVRTREGTVVGYGSLWDEPSQPGRSAYVDLLNVHPAHQGRSLARLMLRQMVDYATDHGYERMTIGTWAANLKAVPLYKKVGFYWKPNTTVYMENYIPTLRRLPILRDFFAQGDWYDLHTRELAQTEDEQRHPKTGEMEVYVSRWRRPNGATVEAVIDRKAQTLTGLETDDFAVFAQVGTSQPVQGLRYPVTWEITNKGNLPLTVQLEASGDEQVEIAHSQSLIIEAEETQTITATFRPATAAPKLDLSTWRPKPTPQIKTRLLLNGQELLLGSGVQYEPAVDISLHPGTPTLTPGLAKRVLVQVKNHLDRPLAGTVRIVDTGGLTTSWQEQPLHAEAQGFASATLELSSAQEQATALKLVATFVAGDEPITTAPQALPVLVRRVGSVAALLHQPHATKRELIVENDFFALGGRQRGGEMWLSNHAGQEYHINLQESLGPPYTPSEFDQRNYELSLRQEGGRVQASFSIASTRFPGLRLGRAVIVTASPVVEVRHWLENEGSLTHVCKIQTTLHLPESFATHAQAALPHRDRLVTTLTSIMPEAEGDFPKRPTDLAEQWGAFTMQGQAHGVIWDADITEHEWRPWYFDLDSAECTVPPHTRVDLSSIQLYCGPGDWQAVRRIWQQRNGQTEQAHLDYLAMPKGAGPQQVVLTPNPVLTLGEEVTVQLQADNMRQQPVNGQLRVTPPPGWASEPTELTVDDLRQGKPLTATLQLSGQNAPVGPAVGQITLQTTGYDVVQPFTILRLGDQRGSVAVTQEQALWFIDNERMRWQVAPNFQAGLVNWHEGGSEINHLKTSFPDDGEFEWMKPWFGGLRPTLGSEEGGWPGKLHQETFAAEPCTAVDAQGLAWRGVRLAANIQRQKTLKGLRAELDYLTLPGSNMLKAVCRLVNETAVYRPAWNPWLGLQLFCQVDGVSENAELYGESSSIGPVQRKRSTVSNWLRLGEWAAVVNPASGRAITAVCASQPDSMVLLNSGHHGGHLMATQSRTLAPHSANELVLYVALVDSLAAARGYACLGGDQR